MCHGSPDCDSVFGISVLPSEEYMRFGDACGDVVGEGTWHGKSITTIMLVCRDGRGEGGIEAYLRS